MSSCLDFIDVKTTDRSRFELTKDKKDVFYSLTYPIEDDTDTILQYTYSIDASEVKIYLYWTKAEAETDFNVFTNAKWSNKDLRPAFEFLPHFKFSSTTPLPQLFIVMHCEVCDTKSISNTFKITNELAEETTIEPGVKYITRKIYSKKLLKFVMHKKAVIAFRFLYTPKIDQELTVETYLKGQLISTEKSTNPIQYSRIEEYDTAVDYNVIIHTNATEKTFELTIELSEFIQPLLLDQGKKINLDFSAKHDLYYYVNLDDYQFKDANSLILSLKQTEGQEPVIPVIYAKDGMGNRKLNEYDQLIPKTKEENLFQIYNKDNQHFILYFKQTQMGRNRLFINIKYNANIPQGATLAVASKMKAMTDEAIESFTTFEFEIEDYIPYHLTITALNLHSNLLVYMPQEGFHRIFLGNVLETDFTINKEVTTAQLHAIKNKSGYYSTYEFLGPKQKIKLYFEPISQVTDYNFDHRQSQDRTIIEFDTFGHTTYYIESSKKTATNYYCFIETIVGQFEYVFKDTITVTEDINTLLPKDTDVSRGIEQLSTSYFIFGIKVRSPGQIAISYREDTLNDIKLTEFIQYSLLFTKDKDYKLTLPTTAALTQSVEIGPIKFKDSKDTIKITTSTGKIYILEEMSKIILPYTQQETITIKANTQFYAAVAIRLSDDIKYTVIDAATTKINSMNVIMKFTEEDVFSYGLYLQQNVKRFKYDIGVGKDNLIPHPYMPTKASYGGKWKIIQNPLNQYKRVPSKGYHYLTMSFEQADLPIPITIIKKLLPTYPYIAVGQNVNITSDKPVSLIKSQSYSLKERNLFMIVSANTTGHNQSVILKYNRGIIQEVNLTAQKTTIELIDLHIPLYLQYKNNGNKTEELNAMVSYGYTSDDHVKELKELVKKSFAITNTTNDNDLIKITWTSVTQGVDFYKVFIMKEGTNTSQFDDEFYLNTLPSKIATTNEFVFENETIGKYIVNVIAYYKDTIPYTIIGTPTIIELKELSTSIWVWVAVGIGSACLVFGLIAFFYFKQKKNNNNEDNQKEQDSLLPRESGNSNIAAVNNA